MPLGAGLEDVEAVLAGQARRAELDAYVGVTVPGSSTSRFEFTTGGVLTPPSARPRPVERAHPLTIGLAAVAALALGRTSSCIGRETDARLRLSL